MLKKVYKDPIYFMIELVSTVNVLKFHFLFLFTNYMLVIRTGIHKMLVRIANREDPDQTASSETV